MQKFILITLCILFANVSITTAQKDKEVKKVIVIKKADENGVITEERFESDGEEFPEEVKNKMKEMKMTFKDTTIDKEVRIEIQREGEPRRKEMNIQKFRKGQGKGPGWKQKANSPPRELRHIESIAPPAPENKAVLGIAIDDTNYGVKIEEIFSGSAAESAGLRRGDILLKVNNSYIFSSTGLLEALNPYNPNDKVKIRYLRDGKEKSATLQLKSRK
ncbi:MAG: PDZ domain-containing protein [Saprospiraceae bacterium]|nr:PDZ domain-containing protein [Saprospiraceae bacterium]